MIESGYLKVNIELQRTGVRRNGRVKRESGESPERCSHCVREFFCVVRDEPSAPDHWEAGQSEGVQQRRTGITSDV